VHVIFCAHRICTGQTAAFLRKSPTKLGSAFPFGPSVVVDPTKRPPFRRGIARFFPHAYLGPPSRPGGRAAFQCRHSRPLPVLETPTRPGCPLKLQPGTAPTNPGRRGLFQSRYWGGGRVPDDSSRPESSKLEALLRNAAPHFPLAKLGNLADEVTGGQIFGPYPLRRSFERAAHCASYAPD